MRLQAIAVVCILLVGTECQLVLGQGMTPATANAMSSGSTPSGLPKRTTLVPSTGVIRIAGPKGPAVGIDVQKSPSVSSAQVLDSSGSPSPGQLRLDSRQADPNRVVRIAPPQQVTSAPITSPVDSGWTFRSHESAQIPRKWRPLEEMEQHAMGTPIQRDRSPVFLDLPSLVARTLQHSKKHQQLEIQPSIARQQINKEYGIFDPTAFVRSQFDKQNLQQRQENNQVSVGVRKNHLYGGALELNQALGVQDNVVGLNSPDQGIASMSVIYSQELLREGGKNIVLSKGLVASYQLDQQISLSQAESSNLIQRTINAYWQLYRARANYFLQQGLSEVAAQLCNQIEERSNQLERSVNSLEQARALYFEAQAELVDSQIKVFQAQDALYRLVNDPSMDPNMTEIITTEGPNLVLPPLDATQEMALAFQSRPEVRERIAAIRQNAVDLQVSLNQLLPKLTVSLKSSLNGFEQDRDFMGAAGNLTQEPLSATAGANFEILMFNRTAKAKNKEANLKATRLFLEYEDQLQGIREEVLVALRVLQDAEPKIRFRNDTLRSREREIDAITEKIWIIPEENVSLVGQLEQLFQAINRLIRTQQQLIDAKVELQTSMVALQRAKGVLVSQTIIPTNNDLPIDRPIESFLSNSEERSLLRTEVRDRVQNEPLPGRFRR